MYLKIVVGLVIGMSLIGCGEEYIAKPQSLDEALSIMTENLRNADDDCGYCEAGPREEDGSFIIRCYSDDGSVEGCAEFNPQLGLFESTYC